VLHMSQRIYVIFDFQLFLRPNLLEKPFKFMEEENEKEVLKTLFRDDDNIDNVNLLTEISSDEDEEEDDVLATSKSSREHFADVQTILLKVLMRRTHVPTFTKEQRIRLLRTIEEKPEVFEELSEKIDQLLIGKPLNDENNNDDVRDIKKCETSSILLNMGNENLENCSSLTRDAKHNSHIRKARMSQETSMIRTSQIPNIVLLVSDIEIIGDTGSITAPDSIMVWCICGAIIEEFTKSMSMEKRNKLMSVLKSSIILLSRRPIRRHKGKKDEEEDTSESDIKKPSFWKCLRCIRLCIPIL